MKIADYAQMSAAEIAHRVSVRDVSAREVVMAALEALDAAEPRIHAFATVARDQALAAADAVDTRLARGEAVGPLAGAPLAGLAARVRDRIDVPVVEGVAAAVRQAELLVSLNVRKATKGAYRRPAPKPTIGLPPALTRLFSAEPTQRS